MTNSFNKMAGTKNSADRTNGTSGRPRSISKLRPMKVVVANSTTVTTAPPRSKPINIVQNTNNKVISFDGYNNNKNKMRWSPSSTGSSPRTSPGLIGGYYAGGKWSEPPSPASLPKPPHHWTQLFGGNGKTQPPSDIASQLKVLLNVHA